MTKKELWDYKSPEERRQSLGFILINTTLLQTNQCSENFNEIGYEYSYDMETYVVFKIQYEKTRDIYFIYSKAI
jgi:hypothetical protein